jgi:hypothetical protein
MRTRIGWQLIETYNRHILWHLKSGIPQSSQGGKGDPVVGRKERRGSGLQKQRMFCHPIATLKGKGVVEDQLWVAFQANLLEGATIPVHPHRGRGKLRGSSEDSDTSMAQVEQELGELVCASFRVAPHNVHVNTRRLKVQDDGWHTLPLDQFDGLGPVVHGPQYDPIHLPF